MILTWYDVEHLPEYERELVTERAALIEYGARMTRSDAERLAINAWNMHQKECNFSRTRIR